MIKMSADENLLLTKYIPVPFWAMKPLTWQQYVGQLSTGDHQVLRYYHTHRILAQGLNIDPEGLALDVIEKVGPGGNFLSQKHTRTHMREIWIPELTHPRLSTNGSSKTDMRQRAKDKLDGILADYRPEPLEEDVQDELRSILAVAEREIGK